MGHRSLDKIFARIEILFSDKTKSHGIREFIDYKWPNEYDFNAVWGQKIIRAQVSRYLLANVHNGRLINTTDKDNENSEK